MGVECRDDRLVIDEIPLAPNVDAGQRPVEDDRVIGHTEAINPRPRDEATGAEPSPVSAPFQSH